ncbi:MAG: hypothetical protein GDYSWBUE_001024 [Candidatus Fervidibacterota bacterium]
MKRITIGGALNVSQVWLGMLQLAQASVDQMTAMNVVTSSLSLGVSVFDCAREYGGHEIMAEVIESLGAHGKGELVIADKSRARSYEDMETAIAESLTELGCEQIGIYMLHDVRGREDFELRTGAWRYLVEAKEMGLVHAIGISTRTVEGVKLAAEIDELDIVQAPFNEVGVGIFDGDIGAMERALELAKAKGKTICAFKVFGGGALFKRWKEALKFVLKHKCVDCICIGATTSAEVRAVVSFLNQLESDSLAGYGLRQRIVIADWCISCGICAQVCPTGALVFREGSLQVDESTCTFCGACIAACLEEAIFIVQVEQL